ncbi:tRNA (guanosine(37)-N1)-methyltransferase TrmD ['Elaeagnus angustifolia' witches'-broom phytoplasma]|uniref:tRNA (guanine-N(1)-)-methyltransferase n=3 Tax=16SrI (Aster yellows group) TaxID=3042590 RepID=A0A859I9M2_9MOLU|nr:tRNA (guanosine(37)-N1)-methyltransferase TrmD [Rice orange leaf phytoplasma]MBT1576732.1 tRNA (guanosine(37)-N1)-methyltransferase TrmD ['Elaeagnus angustifolia' witches'-broom phytoplasma]MBY7576632.1 tRNA (guanosine(37)-N1)-methyltransferase TrmD [Candidatus Phytoplasma australiense]QKX95560.1 MAG: tRNA (guanine(37)-N(1))-methyltransferase [Rapeseed phyllody phytoplasma]MCX2955589.1 tRNA (guanosine(37)-N1)-methyltransferase TrmD [Candidatus Phytoplasma australiense]OIJ44721.1 tRNA (guano
MIIEIITIFPLFFKSFCETSIIKRALEQKKVQIKLHDLRTYSKNKHNQVDDSVYGGGVGMLLSFPPFFDCLQKIKTPQSKVILLSPQGQIFNQIHATNFAQKETHLIILCGNYEGVDARILQYIDAEISIGDYVLTGGEIAATVLVDAITRLLPEVIKEQSYLEDSHQQGLLKYPQYTRPQSYLNHEVPAVLLSGNHAKIRCWRQKESLKATLQKRPDLLENKKLTLEQTKLLTEIKQELQK